MKILVPENIGTQIRVIHRKMCTEGGAFASFARYTTMTIKRRLDYVIVIGQWNFNFERTTFRTAPSVKILSRVIDDCVAPEEKNKHGLHEFIKRLDR